MRTIRALAALFSTVFLVGCATLSGFLGGGAPTVVLSASPTEGPSPLVVRFDASRSEDDARIVEYAWDLGDGTVEASSAGALLEHTYTRSGIFVASLTATDDDGNASAGSVTITVENRPPVASFLLTSDAPVVGNRVGFDASGSFDVDGDLVSFTWEFGDGESVRGMRVSHLYTEVGVYTIRLTVEDNGGETASLAHAVTVHLGGSGGCSGGLPISL